MDYNISFTEYKALVKSIDFLPPFENCCEGGEMKVVAIEPLDGEIKSEVDRTCIVRCSKCEAQYISKKIFV